MSLTNNQTPPSELAAAAHVSDVEQGTWMFYDQAAVATGKSEKTLKRYVKKGQLKIRRMGKQVNSPVQVWITQGFIASIRGESEQRLDDPEIFETELFESDQEPEEVDDEVKSESSPPQSGSEDAYERMLKLMVSEFTAKLDQRQELLFELKKELQEKDLQLKLLPDLQKQLEERERDAHLRTAALEKQIEALKEERLAAEEEKALSVQRFDEIQKDQQVRLESLKAENEKLKDAVASRKGWWGWFLGKS